MSLNPHRGYSTEDIGAGTAYLMFSDVMTAAIAQELTLLPYISKGEETEQAEYKWVEDSLNPFKIAASAAGATSGATSFSLAAGNGKYIRKGTILQTTTQSGQVTEQLQVVDVVGDVITNCTRAYGSTTAVAIGANELLTVIGNPLEGNSDLQLDLTRARIQRSNFCQIFERTVDISRRQIKRGMVAVANEFAKSLKDRTFEVKRELELAMIFGRASAASTKDGDYSTMNGIVQLLTDTTNPNVNANQTSLLINNGAAVITEANLNTWVANVKALGGKVNLVFTSEVQARKFSGSIFIGAGTSGIRWAPSDRVRGAFVRQYLTDSGWLVDILSNPFVRNDTMLLLNSDLLSYHAFKDSDWFMINADTFRDGKASRMLADYTLKLQHAGETHAIIQNLG